MESAVEVLTKLEQNDKWLNENYDKLKADYNNQWVAILNKTVIAHDADLKLLVKKLKKQYPSTYNQIAVEYVTSEELDLIL
jgi:phage FluMu gp28-like protein